MHPKVLSLLAALSVALAASAQDSILYRDFSLVADRDVWTTSHNPAGLTRFSSRSISRAEVYGQLGHGGFTNYSGSKQTVEAGAEVESVYRMSRRVVGYGRMSYSNFTGQKMSGSYLIAPERSPFNLVEDSTTNLGRKHLDTYQLTGGVGVDLWRGLSVGIRADYTAANYAKYKDLRHKNKLMDLVLTVGAQMPIGPVTIGADYFYHRNTESVQFSTYGRTEQPYISLIDYGAFMGTIEQYGGDGFTDQYREQPYVNDYNGFAVQAEWRLSPRLSWYNNFSMAYRKGYYGRKSPYTILYSRHSSHTYVYQTRLQLNLDRSVHHLDLSVDAENLVNRMSHYRSSINEQGATYYQYFDPERSANKVWATTRAAYTGWFGLRGDMALWKATAAATFGHRRQTSYLYPYYRRQHLDNTELSLGLERNLLLSKGILSLRADGSFLYGHGNPADDGTMATPSDKQEFPATMPVWLMREYRWLTAPQYEAGLGVRYSFVFPHTRLKTYVDVAASTRKANGIGGQEYVSERDHTTARVAVGCQF